MALAVSMSLAGNRRHCCFFVVGRCSLRGAALFFRPTVSEMERVALRMRAGVAGGAGARALYFNIFIYFIRFA